MLRLPTSIGLALCISACSSLLGLEGAGEAETEGPKPDADGRADTEDPPSRGADVDAGVNPRSGDSGVDAADAGEEPVVLLPPPACGDMSAYAASTWPMAAACPTFPGAAAVPPLRAPRVAWHRDYAADAVFMAGVSIGADGTIYTAVRLKVDGESHFYVLGITGDGARETLRVELTGTGNGWFSTPTIAADGTLYLRTDGTLTAVTVAPPAVRWSIPLEGGRQTVPLLLPNGSLVVPAEHDLVTVNPTTGATVASIALGSTSSSPTIEGAALSPTGVVYAVSHGQRTGTGGSIHARTLAGEVFFAEKTFEDRPWTQPSFDATGRLFFAGRSAVHLHSADGAPLWTTSTGDISTEWFSTPRGGNVYLAAGRTDAFDLYDTASQSKHHVERRGELRAMVAAGDGSFVVTRSNIVFGEDGLFEGLDAAGSVRWSIPGPAYGQAAHATALGPQGQYYVPAGNSLYAISD